MKRKKSRKKSKSSKEIQAKADNATDKLEAPDRGLENEDTQYCNLHTFKKESILSVRADLLSWYNVNQRQLPWRDLAKSNLDSNGKGYAVWVSEVMLQQTQVATVIKYYNTWMSKWPNVEDLANATLEEVNQVWAGLGYYSRARSLHEGAQHVCNNLNGQIPTEHTRLSKEVKGIGRYTAAAVASIAFGQVVGLVDGNVSRVLSRLRIIGSDITKQITVRHLWDLADLLVDPNQPGDFNQALMELGATVCTPRKPNCQECPLKDHCRAYSMVNTSRTSLTSSEVTDTDKVECSLCLPKVQDIESLGVCVYPQKAAKKAPRKEQTLVLVLEDISRVPRSYLMVRRPDKGLLAGLWEFPNFLMPDGGSSEKEILSSVFKERFPIIDVEKATFAGEVVHVFSHIHSTYKVYKVPVTSKELKMQQFYSDFQWLTEEEVPSAAVPTAMMKVFRCACHSKSSDQKSLDSERKRQKKNINVQDKSQTSLLGFLIKKHKF